MLLKFLVKFSVNKSKFPDSILETKTIIFLPLLGYYFFGNFAVLFNYFLPLGSLVFKITVCFLLLFEVIKLKLNFNLINQSNIIHFLIIPIFLIVSTYDISLHYDSGYYHLNHQNWLINSNIVVGMVNIFWPYGIGSISEYVSSFFWTSNSLINLHYINLVFIVCFYQFLYFHLIQKSGSKFKFPSLFIILFGLLDNFGYQGGRNGFIYIQEVGKQDTLIAVLVILISLAISIDLIKASFNELEVSIIFLLTFLAFQIKVGSFYLFFYLSIYLIIKIKNNSKDFITNIFKILSTTSIFIVSWFTKNLLTSGCLIFPVNFTCFNGLYWYRSNSTKYIEKYTSSTSFGLEEFISIKKIDLLSWYQEFFYLSDPFSTFYRSYYLNFLFSLLLLMIFKLLFFKNQSLPKKFKYLSKLYILFSLSFLIIFGPIPRYSTGILMFSVSLIAFDIASFKKLFYKPILYTLFFLSLALLPRLNSYKSAFYNTNISLPDPRFENNVYVSISDGNWVRPDGSDLCWINLQCTSEVGGKILIQSDFFKVAQRKTD